MTVGASPEILGRSVWWQAKLGHEARADALVAGRRSRAARGETDPVEDFLFTYYPFRFSAIRQWSPGAGVQLAEATEFFFDRRFRVQADGLVSLVPPTEEVRHRLSFHLSLCHAVALRPAFLGCFGLHEWAMVFENAAERRHSRWPLRLGSAGTDAVVRSLPLRCTHYDAFRFFTPPARPLNRHIPTLAQREENEQPGCVHVTMDLYKWTMKSAPWVPASLAADTFELAREAREIDMRASPYDFSAIGLKPICIETPEGRLEYEGEQRALTKKAAPLRDRLIIALKRALIA
jgi:hypothetical protein